MINLIIIGASGLIGSELLKKFANKEDKEDFHIIAVSLNDSDFKEKLELENIVYESYDKFKERLNKKENLSNYIVLNLAYPRQNDKEIIKSGIDFTYDVTEVLKKLNIREYIYASTQSVYDNKRRKPAKEEDELKPQGVYGEGKVHLEKWLLKYALENNIHLTIIRIASLVGKGMDQRITARLVESAVKTKTININESGQIFSYTHIQDIIDIIYEYIKYIKDKENSLEKSKKVTLDTQNNKEETQRKNQEDLVNILNVGTDEKYFLKDIAEEIKKQLKSREIDIDLKIKEVDADFKNNSINVEKLYNILSWRPKYKLKNIIEEEIKRQIDVL